MPSFRVNLGVVLATSCQPGVTLRSVMLATTMSDWNDTVIAQFRAGEPRIADMFDREGLTLLHTTGARSGEERVSPVALFRLDGRLVVIASAAGAPKHPAWYHNLQKNPRVTIEVADGPAVVTETVVARDAEGEEREQLWERVTSVAPGFAGYQEKTDRLIPVVVLTEA